MGRLTASLLGLALALTTVSCDRDPEPVGPYRLFVPAIVRTTPRKFVIQWKTRVTVTNPGPQKAQIRFHRWPPAHRTLELFDMTLDAGQSAPVPSLIPPLPAISSLYVESDQPVSVSAIIEPKTPIGIEPLSVPVLHVEDLAGPGDTLVIEGFLSDKQYHSQYTFTMPWTEKDAVPYKIRLVMKRPDGRVLVDETRTVPGVPWLVYDPWLAHGIPPEEKRFNLEVTVIGGNRGRTPRYGMWVYGMIQDRGSSQSRFLETRVLRAHAGKR